MRPSSVPLQRTAVIGRRGERREIGVGSGDHRDVVGDGKAVHPDRLQHAGEHAHAACDDRGGARCGDESSDEASRNPNSAEKPPVLMIPWLCVPAGSGERLLEAGDALARGPGRGPPGQERDARMTETEQILGRRANAPAVIERHRVQFRRLIAVEQHDGNGELLDLPAEPRHPPRCSSS